MASLRNQPKYPCVNFGSLTIASASLQDNNTYVILIFMTKQAKIMKKARALGYVTLDQMHRELMKKKGFRDAYESLELEDRVIHAMIRARIGKKLSQAQLAKKANMHQSAVARFESGGSNPRLDTLVRVATALDVRLIK